MRFRLSPWSLPLALAGATVIARPARADECGWLDSLAATQAEQQLAGHPTYVIYCESCGDRAPGIPVHVEHAELRRVHDGAEIVADGITLHLATTYVKTAADRYENLALLAGCYASGIVPSLRVEDATTTGVLIVPDTTPVTRPAPVEPPAPPVAVPTPPPGPAPFAYVTYNFTAPDDHSAVAAGLGGLAGALIVIAAGGLRRRRQLRPRAIDLRPG